MLHTILAAAQLNKVDDVKRLYRRNPELLNVKNEMGDTPFLVAVKNGSTTVINDLIELSDIINNPEIKIDPNFINAKDKDGNNALLIAAQKEDIITISKLLEHTGFKHEELNNFNHTALHVAIIHDRYNAAKILLDSHNINYLRIDGNFSDTGNATFFTPIQLAVALNRRSLIKLFNEAACINSNNKFDNGNLLHLAIQFNSVESFNCLVHEKNMKSKLEEMNFNIEHSFYPSENIFLTPLGYAAFLGRINFFSPILNNGILIEQKNYNGNTAMHLAILGKQEKAINYLNELDQTRNLINIQNADRKQPLAYADALQKSISGYERICNQIQMILNKKIDPQKEIKHENLVLQGGGPKGIAYIGALKKLNEFGKLENIKNIAGTSAGAITAGMLAIGLSPEEMEKELKDKPLLELLDYIDKGLTIETLKENVANVPESLKKLRKPVDYKEWIHTGHSALKEILYATLNISGLIGTPLGYNVNQITKQNSLCYGNDFLEWINVIIKAQTGISYFTLGDLKRKVNDEKTYRHIKIYGSRIDGLMKDGAPILTSVEFSSKDDGMKDLILADLIRISMSIPILFSPHQVYRRHPVTKQRVIDTPEYYFDGGLLNNYPIEAFDEYKYVTGHNNIGYSTEDNKKTLGFSLMSQEEIDIYSGKKQFEDNNSQINSANDIFKAIFQTFYNHEGLTKLQRITNKQRTVVIGNKDVSLFDFDMTTEKQNELIDSGIVAVENFISSKSADKNSFANKLNHNNEENPKESIQNPNGGLDGYEKHSVYTESRIKDNISLMFAQYPQFFYFIPSIVGICAGIYDFKIQRVSGLRSSFTAVMTGAVAYGITYALNNVPSSQAFSINFGSPQIELNNSYFYSCINKKSAMPNNKISNAEKQKKLIKSRKKSANKFSEKLLSKNSSNENNKNNISDSVASSTDINTSSLESNSHKKPKYLVNEEKNSI